MSEFFKKKAYKPRIVDKTIEEYLKNCGAICIEGPKWCGKTWTSTYHSKSFFYVGNPDNNFSNRELAVNSSSLILSGENPRMIDEWQEVPALWDATRAKVDELGTNGLFVLTGSSTPKKKGVLHSGAGRIVNIRMSTMSLFESGASSGLVSLEKLCSGILDEALTGEVDLKKLADLIVRGGWPKNIHTQNPTILPKSYMDKVIESNLSDGEDEYKYSYEKTKLILKSLARNESTTASIRSISKDIKETEDKTISSDTVSRYVEALDRMFLFNNQEPFSPKRRSSLRVKMAEKRHFCDPALAASLLNLNAKKLLNDLETFGFLFESLVERDMRVYAESFGAKLYHYQNYDNDEIDAVVELNDGEWAAFEIKLGASKIEEAAKNLIRIENKMIRNGEKPPKAKCVICGLSNAAYKRKDGVLVVPVTALKN